MPESGFYRNKMLYYICISAAGRFPSGKHIAFFTALCYNKENAADRAVTAFINDLERSESDGKTAEDTVYLHGMRTGKLEMERVLSRLRKVEHPGRSASF